jgi:hypothetical protein
MHFDRSFFGLAIFLVTAGIGFVDAKTSANVAIAVVVDLNGEASLMTSSGDGTAIKLKRFDRLRLNDTITTTDEARVIVAFMSGFRFEIGTNAEVDVKGDQLRPKRGKIKKLKPVATGPAIQAIPASSRPGHRSGAIRIRSAAVWGGEVRNLYPRDGASIRSDHAVLTFDPLSAVEKYRIDIEDEMGESIFAVETTSLEIEIPAGILKPANEYYWRVRSSGRPSLGGQGEALFVTMTTEQLTGLKEISTQLQEEKTLASFLLLAEVDRSLGMFREACGELHKARKLAAQQISLDEEWTAFNCEGYWQE